MATRGMSAYLLTTIDYFTERPHGHLSVLAVAKRPKAGASARALIGRPSAGRVARLRIA